MTDPTSGFDRILASLRTDDPPVEPEILEQAISELRQRDIRQVAMVLEPCLNDTDLDYRCTIASVFLACDAAIAIPYVGQMVYDENEELRGFACMELGAYRRREAAPFLIHALMNDPDATNRTWAAWGLGNIGDPAALPALRKAAQSDDGVDYEGRPVKQIAAEAIRRITQEKVASVA